MLKKGDKLHGFTVVDIEPQEEYQGRGIRLEHDKTGLDLYHLLCDDRENLFAFTFKTIPGDDMGIPHIVEHSVLSGSRRYPVKDPFLSLMRGSMNTFLNAMTYPDKTVYPAASPVEKDYFNLMSVYGDAVFFPTLSEEVFRQEGIRLERDDTNRPAYTGIVFNEMKGAYSNHDSIVGEWSYRSLFPDTPYRHDSGGEPTAIPDLTYEAFREFHQKWYHPSNCRLFLYGNIETERQLAFLQEQFLSSFTSGPSAGPIPKQQRWEAPRRFSFTSPGIAAEGVSNEPGLADDGLEGQDLAAGQGEGGGEGAGGRSSIVLSWIIGDITDPDEVLALEVLAEVLLGHVGSPLYKTVVDSGLGEDISPVSGLETDLQELVFAVGIRGTDPGKSEAFEKLIEHFFAETVRKGLPSEAVEGALKRVEFRQRELKGGYPFGLRLMGKALRGWLHGGKPSETLGFTQSMERLKAQVAGKPSFFEELVEKRFRDNPHRATVSVRPDSEHEERIEGELQEHAETVLTRLDRQGEKELEEKNERLKTFQDRPDSPEAVASIPSLSIEDVPREVEKLEVEETRLGDTTVFLNKLYTNGILYTDFIFSMDHLDRRERLYLPLFTRLLLHTSLPGMSYDQVAHRLFRDTGGLYSFLESSPVLGGTYQNLMVFRLKSLEDGAESALDLALSIFMEAILQDRSRLKEVLLEMRNDLASGVISSGNSVAALRASSFLSPTMANDELWRGASQLLFLDELVKRGDPGLSEAVEILETIRKKLFSRERLMCNITADADFIPSAASMINSFLERLPAASEEFESSEESQTPGEAAVPESSDEDAPGLSGPGREEALIVPSSVNFVAAVLPGARIDSPDHPLQLLLSQILKTTFLWERIRMRGGAYGAGAFTNGLESVFGFSSYRDPKILSTVTAFREGLELVAQTPPTQEEIEKAIISLVGKETRPQSPGEKSMIGFRRLLYGISDEVRQQKRDILLSADRHRVAGAARELLKRFEERSLVVVAGKGAADKAGIVLPGLASSRIHLPV